MADQGASIDLGTHERAYRRFLRLARIGAAVAGVLALAAIFAITH